MSDDSSSDYASDISYSNDDSGRCEPSQRATKSASGTAPTTTSAADLRVVRVNDRGANNQMKFRGNSIRTSKYTVITFLPKNLFEQFSKLANLYFLVAALLTVIPTISPLQPWSSFLPLAFVVAVSAVREAIEDFQRHRADNAVNNSQVEVLEGSAWVKRKWKDVVCGDFVRVNGEDQCPADMVLFASSDETEGVAFLETANLDGETNLKRRVSLPATREKAESPEYLARVKGTLECEKPNNRLYVFNGKLELDGKTYSVSNDNVLLRGTRLMNTEWAHGLVCYAGHDTKVMQNSTDAVFKRSRVDRLMSRYLVIIIVFEFVLVAACGAAGGVWQERIGKTMPFLLIDKQASSPLYGFVGFFTFFILISAMIPISLYVSIELVKVVQSALISYDAEMYYEDLDKSSKARTSTLTEELGQVKYIFSDKTGTLTQNRMEFMKLSVTGTSYGTAITEAAKAAMLRGENVGVAATDGKRRRRRGQGSSCSVTGDYYSNDFTATDTGASVSYYPTDYYTGSTYSEQQEEATAAAPRTSTATVGESAGASAAGSALSSTRDASLSVSETKSSTVDGSKVDSLSSTADGSTNTSVTEAATGAAENRAPDDDEDSPHVDFDQKLFDDLDGSDDQSENLRTMMELLAVCNTAIPEPMKPGVAAHISWRGLTYQAASPDESALVKAAAQFGWRMVERTQDEIVVEIKDDDTETFEVLNVLEFSSDRKRMSIIVRRPDGATRMYIKGADSVVLGRCSDKDYEDVTKEHMDIYAREGLRTLVCAYKDIDEGEYEDWNARWEDAKKAVVGREELVDELADEMENDFTLLGALAIEDKLQDGVPTTISTLAKAGINIWVLTGDKQETAINIAYASALLGENMNLIKVNETSRKRATERLQSVVKEYTKDANRAAGRKDSNALVMDGQTLSFVLARKRTQDLLFEIGKTCVAIVFCRVSPLQKAQVVQLVRARTDDITLAVGDGANDVSMIREAHIGVGIAGVEGAQAVMASDYALGQFRFLLRLLLVHGRWSYRRITMLILYSFYKNFAFNLTQIWFNVWAGMSGQTYIDQFYVSTFNLFYSALPPMFFAVFDQDVSARSCFLFPGLYQAAQTDKPFNIKVFSYWLLDGVYQSFVLFWVPWAYFNNNILQISGKNDGMYYQGAITFFCIVVAVNIRLMLMTKFWSAFNHFIVVFSIMAWPCIAMVYHASVTFGTWFSIYDLFPNAHWYLLIILTGAMANIPAFIVLYIQQTFYPTPQDVVLKLNISADPRVPLSDEALMHLAESRAPGRGAQEFIEQRAAQANVEGGSDTKMDYLDDLRAGMLSAQRWRRGRRSQRGHRGPYTYYDSYNPYAYSLSGGRYTSLTTSSDYYSSSFA